MEVDGKEPSQSHDATPTVDDLPNEILVAICGKLKFADLLTASVVCTRWNNVIFHFFSHRIAFRLRSLSIPFLSGTRIYRNVRITGRFVYSPSGLNECRFAAFGEDVRSLNLEASEVRGVVLARILAKFPELVSLRMKVPRYANERSPSMFRLLIKGVLPALEHLTIVCHSYYCTELLAQVASTLDSLDITLMARHRLKLYECNLASLRSLTLSMEIRSMMYLYNMVEFPVHELVSFLAGLPNLRVLRLQLDHPETFLQVYSLRNIRGACGNIVELSLGGLDPEALNCSLDGIAQMVRLRTLSITAHEVLMPSEFQPASTVTSLKLYETATVDIQRLVRVFPSLTVFCMQAPHTLTLSEIKQIVAAWPALEELTVWIGRISEDIGECFLKLLKLRKLALHGCLLLLKSGPFERIITMPSLKQLFLNDSAWGSYYNYLPAVYKRAYPCAVYLNGVQVDEESYKWFL